MQLRKSDLGVKLKRSTSSTTKTKPLFQCKHMDGPHLTAMLEMTSVPQTAVSMGRKLLPSHLVR